MKLVKVTYKDGKNDNLKAYISNVGMVRKCMTNKNSITLRAQSPDGHLIGDTITIDLGEEILSVYGIEV